MALNLDSSWVIMKVAEKVVMMAMRSVAQKGLGLGYKKDSQKAQLRVNYWDLMSVLCLETE